MRQMKATGDQTADFLLERLRLLRRLGSPEQKRDAERWEQIVRRHAQPENLGQVVNFATPTTEGTPAPTAATTP